MSRTYGAITVWFHRAVVGLAALVILTTTGSRFASAAARDVVAHCCCGDHGIDDTCPCRACPANRIDRERGAPPQPTLDRCDVEGASRLAVMLPVFDDRASTVTVPGPAPISVACFARFATTTSPTLAPPYEPPR